MPPGENTGMEALVTYLSYCLLYGEEIFRRGSGTVPARILVFKRPERAFILGAGAFPFN
jgi:hypothetical protein